MPAVTAAPTSAPAFIARTLHRRRRLQADDRRLAVYFHHANI
jgi:hypothetical protein